MLRRLLLAALVAGWPLVALAQTPKAPARGPDDLAAALPIDIPEVISGGGWQAAGQAGVYRALVVVSPTPGGSQARVYVQWIGIKASGGVPEVVRTLAIKDVTDRQLPNAQLSLEADAENEAVIVVSSFDPQSNRPTTLAYKATLPGQLAKTTVPPGYGGQAPTGGPGAPAAGGSPPSQKK
jgi:hypothetical protein